MEFFLDKRSMIAVGGHPLPGNWVYPKKLRHVDLRLPPCAGGPIPTAYAREDARSVAVVKMLDDNADVEESDEVKKERNEMQEYLILSFVDRTRITKKNFELYNKAFKSWAVSSALDGKHTGHPSQTYTRDRHWMMTCLTATIGSTRSMGRPFGIPRTPFLPATTSSSSATNQGMHKNSRKTYAWTSAHQGIRPPFKTYVPNSGIASLKMNSVSRLEVSNSWLTQAQPPPSHVNSPAMDPMNPKSS
jgi:hypothetical protein